MTSRNDASGHLKECPNGVETGQIPDQGHHDLPVHWVFLAAVEACCLRVGDLLQQRHSPQGSQKLLQTLPAMAADAL